MAIDIQKFFNQQLLSSMAKHPDSAKAIGGKFQINITGGGGGEWFVDASYSGPNLQKGNPGGADVTITIAAEDFQKMMEDPKNNVMQLYFSGKLKVTGDQMRFIKFSDLLLLGLSVQLTASLFILLVLVKSSIFASSITLEPVPDNVPDFESIARIGVGVFDTMKTVARLILRELEKGNF